MHHLKAGGILAIALMLVPFMWNGYQELSDLRDASGPACIVDGDVGRRIGTVAQPGRLLAVGQRSDGRCQLGASFDSGVTWSVDGTDYTQTTNYTAGDPFPAAAWNWPITLTWHGNSLRTLGASGWVGQAYDVWIRMAPLATLVIALGMAFYVWTEREFEEWR